MESDVAKNVEKGIAQGAPTILYRQANKSQQRRNRRATLRGQTAAGPGKSLDEYLFASTRQGGAGACVSAVCATQNSSSGGKLGQFFKKNNIKDGDAFDVRVVE